MQIDELEDELAAKTRELKLLKRRKCGVCFHTYMHTYEHMYTHIMYTHTYLYTHTYMYIHTLAYKHRAYKHMLSLYKLSKTGMFIIERRA